jgi:hypothetical protein
MVENMESLKLGLKEFGLNPREWVLRIQVQFGDIKKIEVKSKDDQELKFEGWVEAGKWRSLALHG